MVKPLQERMRLSATRFVVCQFMLENISFCGSSLKAVAALMITGDISALIGNDIQSIDPQSMPLNCSFYSQNIILPRYTLKTGLLLMAG